jgi:hypothetical protein
MADNKIKGLYGTFVFVGTPVIPKEKFITTGNNDGGYVWKKIQFGIKTDDTNVGYLEMMGGYHTKKSQTIYSLDTKNNKLEIDWKDRLNDKIIASIADFKKIKVNFTTSSEKESKSYLAEYDAIEDIRVNLKADVRYVVVGNIKVDRYKDSQGQYKTSVKYIPTKIRLAKDDEANKTEATIQFVFDKDSWDESRFAEEKKVDILAYTTVYDKALKDNVFVPFSFVLNCEKLDMNNPAHKKMFDFYKGCFNVKSGEIYETQWHCKLFRGANEEEITMDDLSDDQKMQIE